MDNESPEPETVATLPTTRVLRHDGWTGDKMAAFCETLAETAVVADACDAANMGISGAYAARRRNPVFAAAWEAALGIARERLADTLLARSMEGNVEQIYKDGVLVGERHVIDNHLGLAILRRLDRLAETGAALHSNPPAPGAKGSAPATLPRAKPIDWSFAVEALRTGDDEGVARALALIESHEVEEVEDPLNRPPSPCHPGEEEDDNDGLDLTERCWFDEDEELWLTDFPPPADFHGYESCPYDDLGDDESYVRACTPEEVEALEADEARARGAERAEEEELRDLWFAQLRADQDEDDADAPARSSGP